MEQKDSEVLSRYMTLPKFISLFRSGDKPFINVNFTRLSALGDPLEGALPVDERIKSSFNSFEDYIRAAHAQGGAVNDLMKTQQLFESSFEFDIEEYRKEVRRVREETFVNCWFNLEEESLPMWNLYAGKTGVLVQLKKSIITKKLTDKNQNIEGHDVAYDKGHKRGEERFLFKDKFYKYENEFRFVIKNINHSSDHIIKSIDIDQSLNIKIYTHPECPEWIALQYEYLIKQFSLQDFVELRDSELAYQNIIKKYII